MKRAIVLISILALCLALCACGEGTTPAVTTPGGATAAPNGTTATPNGTVPEQTTGAAEEQGTTAPAQCAHDYAAAETKAATCAEEGVTTYTCSKCSDSYTEAIAKLEHTYADATCTAPKTCSACGATDGEAAGHTWSDATCTAPKTCSGCSATEGEVTAHNFQNGTCASCGAADPSFKELTSGKWSCKKIVASTGFLTHQLLNFSPNEMYEDPMWHVSHTEPISDWDPETQKEIMDLAAKGDVTLQEFEGKYFFGGMGDLGPITFTTEGNMVHVTLVDWDCSFSMQRTAGDQFTVTAVNGNIKSAMGDLTVGEVFTWVEK